MNFAQASEYLFNGKKITDGIEIVFMRDRSNLERRWIDGGFISTGGGIPPTFFNTLWELYEEPAPAPAEKTLGQELYEIYESVFGSTGIAWNDRDASYRDRYEIIAQRFEPKVLSRHWLTMQKMAATTPAELLIKTCYEKGWGWKDAAATIEAEVLRRHRESLPKIEGKTAGQVLLECDETNSLWGLKWDHLKNVQHLFEKQAAAFLSAYQLAQPQLKLRDGATAGEVLKSLIGDKVAFSNDELEWVANNLLCFFQLDKGIREHRAKKSELPEPKVESAIERLFNSGFGMSRLFQVDGQSNARIESFGQAFEGKGETPERAAAAAIGHFKNFIAGM